MVDVTQTMANRIADGTAIAPKGSIADEETTVSTLAYTRLRSGPKVKYAELPHQILKCCAWHLYL